MLQDFLSAVALMLVLEGILPFLNPGRYRKAMITAMMQTDNRQLRMVGLASMLGGLLLLYLVRN